MLLNFASAMSALSFDFYVFNIEVNKIIELSKLPLDVTTLFTSDSFSTDRASYQRRQKDIISELIKVEMISKGKIECCSTFISFNQEPLSIVLFLPTPNVGLPWINLK